MLLKLTFLSLLTLGCSGQTTLRQYLDLTPTQTASIVRLNQDYQIYSAGQDNRANNLYSQLYNQFYSSTPDPQQLGGRALDLENIRRDKIAKQSALQTSVASQLTPTQALAIQNLIAAANLLPLANDAQCAYLVQQPLGYWNDTTAVVPGSIDSGVYLGGFSNPPMIPSAPTASFCNSQIFPVSVRQYLLLTDAQVAAIYQASAAYNDFYARRQNRLAELNQQAAAMLAAGAVDATGLGLLYVEILRIGQEIKDRSSQLRDSAQSQLTAAQQIKLKTLQDAENLSGWGVIANAVGCNLLLLPAGSAVTGTTLSGITTYCSL